LLVSLESENNLRRRVSEKLKNVFHLFVVFITKPKPIAFMIIMGLWGIAYRVTWELMPV
jgi:hypothetical protein